MSGSAGRRRGTRADANAPLRFVGADLCVGPSPNDGTSPPPDDGTSPFHAVGAAICRPGKRCGDGGRADTEVRPYRVMLPIQIYAVPTTPGTPDLSGRGWGEYPHIGLFRCILHQNNSIFFLTAPNPSIATALCTTYSRSICDLNRIAQNPPSLKYLRNHGSPLIAHTDTRCSFGWCAGRSYRTQCLYHLFHIQILGKIKCCLFFPKRFLSPSTAQRWPGHCPRSIPADGSPPAG